MERIGPASQSVIGKMLCVSSSLFREFSVSNGQTRVSEENQIRVIYGNKVAQKMS